MDAVNLDSLQIAVYGLGGVGALTATRVIVTWLKSLLGWDGQKVRVLTTVVSAYVVATLVTSAFAPGIAVVMGAIFLVAMLATTADALYAQEQRDRGE